MPLTDEKAFGVNRKRNTWPPLTTQIAHGVFERCVMPAGASHFGEMALRPNGSLSYSHTDGKYLAFQNSISGQESPKSEPCANSACLTAERFVDAGVRSRSSSHNQVPVLSSVER